MIDYKDPISGLVDRRAALVQAKLLKRGAVRPSGREWLQHELLAWLPSFEFVDAAYDRRSRDLAAGLVGDPAFTAEYGSIELSTANWLQWLPQTSRPCFTGQIDLGTYLAKMATGDRSCSREAILGGSDDWSYTVDELLRVTAAKPIVKADPTTLRGNRVSVEFMADATTIKDGGGGGDASDLDEEWRKGPISTVHLTVSGLDDTSGFPEADEPFSR
ncbi:hypothetical protein K3163_02270 [Qipengyuania sp. 1NDW9]|uniref:hypothetical protein n=1 Tax=Qipengyuania xiapuensis TaxID=2867236 RepID=UPI001C88170B|nr:hypothetical protein [Qipengyuania xiapuensis]MBX7492030.1 hypothetical protein [Qipengyuania xiapuensis]